MTLVATPMLPEVRRDYPGLVARARDGDAAAWTELVHELKGVVWATVAEFGLSADDRKDVFAASFCRLVERLDTVRDPDKLPGWMATTTRNEARTLLRSRARFDLRDEVVELESGDHPTDDRLLRDELRVALRGAFGRLGRPCQDLLRLAAADPPIPYDDIAVQLAIPRGSIGPTRQRCLDRLRQTPELRAFLEGSRR